MTRRSVLASGAFSAAAAPVLAQGRPSGYDPRASAEGQIKLLAALDGSPVYWTYSGLIYAVLPERRPQPILAISGGQASQARRRADGSYRASGAILTFFRDVNTGAFLESYDNPFTGVRTAVAANILTGGGLIYPADGSSAFAEGQIAAAAVAPDGFKASDPSKALGVVRWSVTGPSVMLMTDRSWNVARQPQLEAQTQVADRAAFFDPKVVRLPTSFTATTIIPWMAWMGMGNRAGHLMWHSSGQKVFSVNDMDPEYLAHAGDRIEVLTTPRT
jgi:hypothetical protein